MLRQCSIGAQDSITYSFLPEEKLLEAVECFSHCFEHENQIIAAKVTYQEFFDWAVDYIRTRVMDKSSVCLIANYSENKPSFNAGNTSKIVGLSICEDVTTKDPDDLYLNSTPKFNPLDALIAEMLQYYATQFLSHQIVNQNFPENNHFGQVTTQTQTQTQLTQTNSGPHHEGVFSFLNYNAQYNLPKGEHFRIAFLAVSSEFRGHGIGRTLVTKSIEVARQRGYKYVVCEASSETSQRLFRSLGFKLIKLFKYKEFVWNGEYPLASISDSEGCALMGMNLLNS